ncbi:MAG TPA: cation:proton antiporter [Candidatus Polarisedimenticolia bacterium]|nr:cation:proton antiporter [Candidatus Polarisedimenticolia bacterium]
MNEVLQILLLLSLITIASKGAGALSVRLGQPAVFGEILVGLLLGPSLLNVLGWRVFAPHGGASATHLDPAGFVHALAEIGVVLLMFVAGMETDLAEMRRVGKVAFWAAIGGVVLPLFTGAWAAHLFNYGWSQGFFMGAVLTATSVSISAQTLMELKSLRSKEGSTILGAAVIDDVMGIVVLSLVVAFAGSGASTPPAAAQTAVGETVADAARIGSSSTAAMIAWVTFRMVFFFALAWILGRRTLGRLAAWAARLTVSEPLMALVVVVTFLYAWAAEYLGGVAAITGSYMAGVLFAQTSCKERIDRGIHPLTYSFFVPVFLINIGLRADVRQLIGQIPLTLFILTVAILGKVVGCGVLALLAGFDRREALRVGVGMISRGEVGLIVAGYGLAHGIIENDIFSAMVLMVLVTTMITPIWLRRVFPRVDGEGAAPVYESVAHLERHEN